MKPKVNPKLLSLSSTSDLFNLIAANPVEVSHSSRPSISDLVDKYLLLETELTSDDRFVRQCEAMGMKPITLKFKNTFFEGKSGSSDLHKGNLANESITLKL
jgi:hypothetical protein